MAATAPTTASATSAAAPRSGCGRSLLQRSGGPTPPAPPRRSRFGSGGEGPRGSTVETLARVSAMSQATLHTSAGAIVLELHDEDAPKTVENVRKLSADGFYDQLVFHRVIPDFMIQGGCPEGTGRGGPGYTFEDEINDRKIVRGALAMANAGPNTNGSQFFIVTTGAAPWLDGKHTVFGQVTSGMEAVDSIESVPNDAGDKPLEAQTIERVELDDA